MKEDSMGEGDDELVNYKDGFTLSPLRDSQKSTHQENTLQQ